MSKININDLSSYYGEDQRSRAPKKKPKVNIPNQLASAYPIVRHTEKGNKVSVYTSSLDSNAWKQAEQFADLPFVHPKGLSLMPDVHFGMGIPVGSVLPTLGVLVPAAVGTDIGCGMEAVKLDINANHLPDFLRPLRREIELLVPLSSGGRHKNVPDFIQNAWLDLDEGHKWLLEKYPGATRKNPMEQLGTLGAGNHFIEICLDESKNVWIMLHSGSRGSGSAVGNFFIEKARQRVQQNNQNIGSFGWLNEDDPLFDAYVKSVEWAQQFAFINRQCMLQSTIKAVNNVIGRQLGRDVNIVGEAINCHHNYISRENFHGEDVWITRKGAIRAKNGDLGIIPGSMGQESFIVKGKGGVGSWDSCSHGAGRVLSRTAAKAKYTAKDLKEATRGVECRKDKSVVDEIPYAYKPLHTVMKEQKDLVSVVHTLKAVLCVKGI